MYKYIFFVLLMSINMSAGIQSKIPASLQELLDSFQTDTMMIFGFHDLKESNYFDKSVDIKSIKVGPPVEVFDLDESKLESLPENAPVSSYTTQKNYWLVPVYVKGRCVCTVSLYFSSKEQKWKVAETECCAISGGWEKVRKAWPENKGVDPVVVKWGIEYMLHFPSVNDYNLTYFPNYQYGKPEAEGDYMHPELGSNRVFNTLRVRQKEVKKYREEHPYSPAAVDNGMGGENEAH